MIRIITDSASDITLKEARMMNIQIVPLRIRFLDGECQQGSDADFARFYERLARAQELPKTSQPSPGDYLCLYKQAKQCGDEVIVISLSSGLSGTVQVAKLAKEICEYEKIYVIDSHQAITAQRILVDQAVKLRDEGLTAEAIVHELETLKDHVTVSGVVNTLTYLRKGGRIPAGLALVGNALRIKPVIMLEDRILKTIGKALGWRIGIKLLYQRFEQNEPDPEYPIYFAYSSNRKLGEQFMEETIKKYALQQYKTNLYPVGGIIGTHVGTNCVAIAYVRKKKTPQIKGHQCE